MRSEITVGHFRKHFKNQNIFNWKKIIDKFKNC